MADNTEKIRNLRDYYDKLAKILRNEAYFKMFGKAIFDKRRIDDAMCCIDANFPREFKAFKSHSKNMAASPQTPSPIPALLLHGPNKSCTYYNKISL